jgi:hypothetical protein
LHGKAAPSSVPGLRIGRPDDAYEQEADCVTNDVMTGGTAKRHWSLPHVESGTTLQRKCSCGASGDSGGECEKCKKEKEGETLQRKATGPAGLAAPPVVHEALNSPGQPLDPATRRLMETRFGHDFSKVRVHTDSTAAESARSINALAYTVGSDVVFGTGGYAPGTSQGNRLLAHELAHTIQQAPVIARQAGIIPAPPLDLSGPASKKAHEYKTRFFRPHVPQAPTISPPPVPEEDTPPVGPCPSTADVASQLKQSDVASKTETEMERDINLGKIRAGRARPESPTLIAKADAAIRKEFGSILPAGRKFTDPKSVDTHTPADFAKQRVPDDTAASRFIGQAALEAAGKQLRDLCITTPDNPQLQSEVAAPILKRRKIDFVRDHQSSRIGGLTTFPENKGKVTPHVDLPSSSANMGHIVVHEAMHFYVSDAYRRTAEASKLDKELMEGGAEYLARGVINARLGGDPDFAIHYGTYAAEFGYVTTYLLHGGLSSFKLAYFQGRTDLLGLPPVQPKLAISQPGDEFEREAEEASNAVVQGHQFAVRGAGVRGAKPAPSSVSGGLRLGQPNDPHEREADRIANEVISGGAGRHHWSLPSASGLAVPISRESTAIVRRAGPDDDKWDPAYRSRLSKLDKPYETFKAGLGEIRPTTQGGLSENAGRPIPERKGAGTPAVEITMPVLKRIYPDLAKDVADPAKAKKAQAYLDSLNLAFKIMKIDTAEAQALYLAHAFVESDQFRQFVETQGSLGKGAQKWMDDPTKAKLDTSGVSRYKTDQTVNPMGKYEFIGRGPVQVTHRAEYVENIAMLEKVAAQYQKETGNKDAQKYADLAREAAAAIKADPNQAANPKYSFLFSAAHMKKFGVDVGAAGIDPNPEKKWTGQDTASGWVAGGQLDADSRKRLGEKQAKFNEIRQVLIDEAKKQEGTVP